MLNQFLSMLLIPKNLNTFFWAKHRLFIDPARGGEDIGEPFCEAANRRRQVTRSSAVGHRTIHVRK
jgi:hypothetical protein